MNNTTLYKVPKYDEPLIVYLAGDIRRFEKVYEIYKNNNKTSKILITSFNEDSPLRANNSLLVDKYKSISEKDILTEYYSTSTYTEAVELKKILELYEFNEIIIITSKYHMIRTKLIFNKVCSNWKIKYISANGTPTNHILRTVQETLKLMLFFMKSYKFFTKNNIVYSQNKYSYQSRLFYK